MSWWHFLNPASASEGCLNRTNSQESRTLTIRRSLVLSQMILPTKNKKRDLKMAATRRTAKPKPA